MRKSGYAKPNMKWLLFNHKDVAYYIQIFLQYTNYRYDTMEWFAVDKKIKLG